MNDGTESEAGSGDVANIPPGHDSWVVGNAPCVGIDFTGAKTYARYLLQPHEQTCFRTR